MSIGRNRRIPHRGVDSPDAYKLMRPFGVELLEQLEEPQSTKPRDWRVRNPVYA